MRVSLNVVGGKPFCQVQGFQTQCIPFQILKFVGAWQENQKQVATKIHTIQCLKYLISQKVSVAFVIIFIVLPNI